MILTPNLTHKLFPTQSISESNDSLVVWNLSQPFGRYTLVLKSNYKIVEHITLRISEDQKLAEIGYTLNKTYLNLGYATESLSEIIRLTFKKLKLDELLANYMIENRSSSRALKKAFFEIKHEERKSLRIVILNYGKSVLINFKLVMLTLC